MSDAAEDFGEALIRSSSLGELLLGSKYSGGARALPGLIDRFYDRYGAHDPWNTPCNGFSLEFDFTDCDPHYVGKHRADS